MVLAAFTDQPQNAKPVLVGSCNGILTESPTCVCTSANMSDGRVAPFPSKLTVQFFIQFALNSLSPNILSILYFIFISGLVELDHPINSYPDLSGFTIS